MSGVSSARYDAGAPAQHNAHWIDTKHGLSRPATWSSRFAGNLRRGFPGEGASATSEQTCALLVATLCSAATSVSEANAIPEVILEGHNKSQRLQMTPCDLVKTTQLGAFEAGTVTTHGQVAFATCDPERLQRLGGTAAPNLSAD